MSKKIIDIPDQVSLWDKQHQLRGTIGPEGDKLLYIPNDSAIKFEKRLPQGSTILEVGSANGRDARYWASKGHEVFALDFSQVALDQLKQLAIAQNINQLIIPIVWNIAEGKLPLNILPDRISAFYARSALHLGDEEMLCLAKQIDQILTPGGKIFIEGKALRDKKIMRSKKLGSGLALDEYENGHLRRIWDRKFIRELCAKMGWRIINSNSNGEDWNGIQALFLSFLIEKGK